MDITPLRLGDLTKKGDFAGRQSVPDRRGYKIDDARAGAGTKAPGLPEIQQ
jgi:hypothetical protein